MTVQGIRLGERLKRLKSQLKYCLKPTFPHYFLQDKAGLDFNDLTPEPR